MIGGGILKKGCPICKKALPEEAHFCLYCFHDLNENSANMSEINLSLIEKIKSNKKALIILLTIIILLIIAAISCGIYYSGLNDASSTNDLITTVTEKHAVSAITKEDGSVVTTYDDGSTETLKADGTKITQEADGTVITQKTDGTKITEKPDGTTVTEEPDGTTITEKPNGTIITQKPNGTTQVTEKPTVSTTVKDETTVPAVTQPSTEVPSSDYSDIPINYDNFTFEYRNDFLVITKYNGNDKIIKVPNSYNGDNVVFIDSMAFQHVTEAEQIIFEMAPTNSKLSLSFNVIWYCPNLKSVVFIKPESNNAKLTLDGFIGSCSSLTEIKLYNCNEYKVYDNALYHYDDTKNEYSLVYFFEGAKASEWIMPDWCVNAENAAFTYNKNIKKIYINTTKSIKLSLYTSNYMDSVYINDDNKYYFDDNGVAVYSENMKELQFFSSTANIKEYTIKSGYCFNPGRGVTVTNEINPHLETLRIPKDSDFYDSQLKKYWTKSNSNLKTIYIQEGHPKIDYLKENFTGQVIVY